MNKDTNLSFADSSAAEYSTITQTASSLLGNRFSILPVNQDKRPSNGFKWGSNIITRDNLPNYFTNAYGIGVICGKASDNLEVIDVDLKYDITGSLWTDLASEIEGRDPELWTRLASGIVSTKNGGYHLYYRCEVVEKNQPLAWRKPKPGEPDKKILIETRGEGGYVVAPCTPGYLYQNNTFSVPKITSDERAFLLDIARSYDEFKPISITASIAEPSIIETSSGKVAPWEEFNQTADVNDLLTRYGWQYLYTKGPRHFYLRPGETTSPTSGNWHEGKRTFFCHSTSTSLPPNKGLTPSKLLAHLEFNGDLSACGKWLAAQGYGSRKDDLSDTAQTITRTDYTAPISSAARDEAYLESLRFRPERAVQRPKPTASIQGEMIMTKGNITTIVGQAKAGKSAVIQAGLAGSINRERNEIDTLGIVFTPSDGRAVLHIDTEQSVWLNDEKSNLILKRAQLDQMPEYFVSIRIRGLSVREANETLDKAVRVYGDKFGGIHSIWIDGPGDFVTSVNDDTECDQFERKLSRIAGENDCPVICILHYNPGSDTKGRGHLGSILSRKSESVISVKKDGNTSVIEPHNNELRSSGGFQPIAFQFSESAGYHVSIGTAETKESRADAEYKNLLRSLWVFTEKGNLSKSAADLWQFFEDTEAVKKVTAIKRVKKLQKDGVLEQFYERGRLLYRIPVQLVQSGSFELI